MKLHGKTRGSLLLYQEEVKSYLLPSQDEKDQLVTNSELLATPLDYSQILCALFGYKLMILLRP